MEWSEGKDFTPQGKEERNAARQEGKAGRLTASRQSEEGLRREGRQEEGRRVDAIKKKNRRERREGRMDGRFMRA